MPKPLRLWSVFIPLTVTVKMCWVCWFNSTNSSRTTTTPAMLWHVWRLSRARVSVCRLPRASYIRRWVTNKLLLLK